MEAILGGKNLKDLQNLHYMLDSSYPMMADNHSDLHHQKMIKDVYFFFFFCTCFMNDINLTSIQFYFFNLLETNTFLCLKKPWQHKWKFDTSKYVRYTGWLILAEPSPFFPSLAFSLMATDFHIISDDDGQTLFFFCRPMLWIQRIFLARKNNP